MDVLAAFMIVAGLLAVMSGLSRRPKPRSERVAERAAPYTPPYSPPQGQPSVADEAEMWLKSQNR